MLTLVAMLWPHTGQERALIEYEDSVLALLPTHGGRLMGRVRNTGQSEGPFEIQLIEFADETAMMNYMSDPDRTALSAEHAAAIERTEVVRVSVIEPREI